MIDDVDKYEDELKNGEMKIKDNYNYNEEFENEEENGKNNNDYIKD